MVRYETDDEIALIDPLLPPAGDFDPAQSPSVSCYAAGALPRDGGLRGAFRRIRVGAAEGAVAKATQPRDDG